MSSHCGVPGGSGFIHSVKVPRIYKTAASIVKRVVENGESLKQLVYESRHKNIKGVYALVVETIKNNADLDKLIKKSKLLQRETRLEPWLAKILLTEMIFRDKELKGSSKPVQTVLSYREKLLKYKIGRVNHSQEKARNPRYVRVNTNLCSPDEAIKTLTREGWEFLSPATDYAAFLERVARLSENEFMKDFHVKELLVFHPNASFYNHELYENGKLILQDKASCLPVCLLRPRKDATVLDMCAAPGMKTTHLSARMKNKGKIYAVELNGKRYETLCKIVKSAGCSNVCTVNADSLTIARKNTTEVDTETGTEDTDWYKDVEFILVDPSCSGTGIVERNNIFVNERRDERRVKKLCGFQFRLLLHALTNFPKVKRVVYSTCSVLAEENEKVVDDVLRSLSQSSGDGKGEASDSMFELVEAWKGTWPRRGSEDFECGKYCIYTDPEKDYTNGFFIAVFQRRNQSESFVSI